MDESDLTGRGAPVRHDSPVDAALANGNGNPTRAAKRKATDSLGGLGLGPPAEAAELPAAKRARVDVRASPSAGQSA